MFKRTRPASPTGDIETLVGRTTRIQGNVIFSGGFHLDGQVAGNVRAQNEDNSAESSVLNVSESAVIEGSVEVAHVILNGVVQGDIVARERVQLGPKSRVSGNVYYGVIEMAVGAQISGKLIHTPPAQALTPEASTG